MKRKEIPSVVTYAVWFRRLAKFHFREKQVRQHFFGIIIGTDYVVRRRYCGDFVMTCVCMCVGGCVGLWVCGYVSTIK